MGSLINFWQHWSAAWQRFFFAPIDARRPALVRMGFAALMLVYLAVLYPDLGAWYGPHGLIPADIDQQRMLPQQWSVLRWIDVTDPDAVGWLYGVFRVHVACTVMLLLGFYTRFNAAMVFVLLVSWQNRNDLILEGEDTVFRLVGFYLMLMPSGQAWSLDSLLCKRYRAPGACRLVPAWSLRLLQLQMTVLFVAAGLHKLGGNSWLEGTALSYVGRLDDTFGRFPVPSFLFEVPLLARLMTWSVIVVEIFVLGLLWFRETRHAALAILVFFHLSNEYAMFLFLFHWIMLVGWSTFLTSSDLQFFSRIFRRRTTAP